jgi:hypothetical protein
MKTTLTKVTLVFLLGYVANDITKEVGPSLAPPARAEVSDMKWDQLERLDDFRKAVESIVKAMDYSNLKNSDLSSAIHNIARRVTENCSADSDGSISC